MLLFSLSLIFSLLGLESECLSFALLIFYIVLDKQGWLQHSWSRGQEERRSRDRFPPYTGPLSHPVLENTLKFSVRFPTTLAASSPVMTSENHDI